MERKLWLRVGVELSMTEEEEKLIFGGDGMAAVVKNVVSDGRFALSGDTYIPCECITNYNKENGTSYDDTDVLGCDL